MILGTVELGMAYGINNKMGKPNEAEAFEILRTAWENDVRELDTAAAYGDAEKLIGLFQTANRCYFQIDTKLPELSDKTRYRENLEDSFWKLALERVHLIYLHSFRQCLDAEIFSFLKSLKEEEKTEQIGISIYETSEMAYILDNLPDVDVIQFPFHILNGPVWKRDGLLDRAQASGKRLYARSVYLQGLIFRSPDDPFLHSLGAEKYISKLRQICEREGLSVSRLACCYVTSHEAIRDVIMGCQTPNEVQLNVEALDHVEPLSQSFIEEIDTIMRDFPPNAADPRKWKVS